jgi:HEPN domain-containing protein
MKKRAEEWLEFADVDLRSAEKLMGDEYLTRAAAFHAHQCVEKSIKAVLEILGKRVPKIHDLALLIETIRTNELNPSIDDDVLDEMNQVYIETRYPADFGLLPGGTPTKEIVGNFIGLARTMHRFATKTIAEWPDSGTNDASPMGGDVK